jgi:hypothetical protein
VIRLLGAPSELPEVDLLEPVGEKPEVMRENGIGQWHPVGNQVVVDGGVTSQVPQSVVARRLRYPIGAVVVIPDNMVGLVHEHRGGRLDPPPPSDVHVHIHTPPPVDAERPVPGGGHGDQGEESGGQVRLEAGSS